jgi:hypothetical protein
MEVLATVLFHGLWATGVSHHPFLLLFDYLIPPGENIWIQITKSIRIAIN